MGNNCSKKIDADYYKKLYSFELTMEAEWLRRCAREKVTSIVQLLSINKIRPKTIIELGCGMGEVIGECKARNLAEEYYGVDYSEEAILYMNKQFPDIKTLVADFSERSTPFTDKHFDVVIVSHVLEHLQDPEIMFRFLEKINFSYLIIEVPLEDLILGRVKAEIIKSREENKAGHVQFYTPSKIRYLLNSNNYTILGERKYVPVLDLDTIRFLVKKDKMGKIKYYQMIITRNVLPRIMKPIWVLTYNAHFAVICKK